ncbi:MAG: TPM domain-containing protein [Kofleriaceae bacterium]
MLRALFILALVVRGAIASAAPAPPVPTRWVTDNVGFLSETARGAIDAELESYEARTRHQVIVWIGAPAEDIEPIDDFAARVFKAWGIGRKHADDGVAMFVFPATHDVRIEVGYGLEGQLADLGASHILTEIVVPEMRAGHADAAIQKGVDAILQKLDANGGAELEATKDDASSGLSWWQIVLIVIGGIAFLAFAITHPSVIWLLLDIIQAFAGGGGGGGFSSGGGGGGGFSGGGGSSGGGGASARW